MHTRWAPREVNSFSSCITPLRVYLYPNVLRSLHIVSRGPATSIGVRYIRFLGMCTWRYQVRTTVINHLCAPEVELAKLYLGCKYSYGLLVLILDLQVSHAYTCTMCTFMYTCIICIHTHTYVYVHALAITMASKTVFLGWCARAVQGFLALSWTVQELGALPMFPRSPSKPSSLFWQVRLWDVQRNVGFSSVRGGASAPSDRDCC